MRVLLPVARRHLPLLLVVALCRLATSAPACRADELRLTAHVLRVYTTERTLSVDSTDTLYAIEIQVLDTRGADTPRVGERLFVTTWQAATRPPNWNKERGQREVPERGDIAEFRLTSTSPPFEAAMSDGIQIVWPGAAQSAALGLRMRLIPAGEFLMGSPAASDINHQADEAAHRVVLTKPFYLGVSEVTQWEYHQVMQAKPSAFAFGGSSRDKVARMVTERFPVENVSWFDAVEFCNRLSRLDGYPEYYELTDVERLGGAIASAQVRVVGGIGYRLPTEAEWEYACRAGTTTPYHFGNSSTLKTSNAKAKFAVGGYGGGTEWKGLDRPTKVGTFPPNDWGLYDMHGNVAEWCADWYDKDWGHPENPGGMQVDPRGPAEGTHKVLKGGNWLVQDLHCRSASRLYMLPRDTKYFGGFRVARTPQ